MPAASTAFTIRDAVKAALEGQAFITSRSALVETMPRPTFDTVAIGETIKLVVAAYEATGIQNHDRLGVARLYRIGIGVYKKLEMSSGAIVDADMDQMIQLVEQIEQWGWNGVSGYRCVLSKPATDALYDGPKAQSGMFFNVIALNFAADYDK